MDGRSSTAAPKHPYPHAFPHLITTGPILRPAPHPLLATEASSPLTTHYEILPSPVSFQTLWHQAQLLQYNSLIAPGRGGGQLNSVLSPTVSPNTYAGPRSRSSSKVSNKDVPASKPSGHPSHGNRGYKNADKVDRAGIAGRESVPTSSAAHTAAPSRMPPKQAATAALEHPLPSRPGRSQNNHHPQQQQTSPRAPAQASSVPNTPHQHARNFSYESREPSPNATQNHSPRSTYSDPNGGNPSGLRPLPPRLGGCHYETALIRGRRRMPYSLGCDRLDPVEASKIKSKLSEDEERKLTTDMRELYDRLKPTDRVRNNREKLVKKLERIFNDEWPGHNIKVHLFGSSGNKLCSDDADVDICITTDWPELENVCIIAELLAKRGMHKVVCVSSAKVPIVKMWDPELELACDMNVNNTLALENTRMVLTYVDIDERVRPLAMVVKHWTKRRIINDAAFGGTLSSYTWICMIIAFLQLRDPPVLPALHQIPHKKSKETEFADDLKKLKGFGQKNKETLGELLFNFFKFYAHTFDYDKWVLSIRLGKTITKVEKKWHQAISNMLCVEEPFNIIRNLANTADDTSFRGLHMELRRAFDLVAEAKLDELCEQYVFPKEEERVWQKPAPVPRPIMVRSSSQTQSNRGGRGNYRGNRAGRGNNRRASSSVAYDNSPVAAQGFQPIVTNAGAGLGQDQQQWYNTAAAVQQAQAQYQYMSPDTLFNQAAFYQLSLDPRLQLYQQSQLQAHAQAIASMQRLQNPGGGAGSTSSQTTDRSRAGSFDQPPLSAPLRPPEYAYNIYGQMAQAQAQAQQQYYAQQTGFTTYPSSPVTTTGTPEFRRSLHRNTVTGESGASSGSAGLRSQSQPASRSPMPTSTTQGGVSAYPSASQAAAAAAVANGMPLVTGLGLGMSDLGTATASPTAGYRGANGQHFQARHINGIPISFVASDDAVDTDLDDGTTKSSSGSPPEEYNTRYAGYFLDGKTPPKKTLPNGMANGVSNGMLSSGETGKGSSARRRLSQDQTPQSILDRRMKRTSRSPSPLGAGAGGHSRAFSTGTACTAPVPSTATFPGNGNSKLNLEARPPLVVDGSNVTMSPNRQPSSAASATSGSDVNGLEKKMQGLGLTNGHMSPEKKSVAELSPERLPPLNTHAHDRPLVVNGSTTPLTATRPAAVTPTATPDAKSFGQRIAASRPPTGPANQRISPVVGDNMSPAGVVGPYPQFYPVNHRLSRQQQSTAIAPLDLAMPDHNSMADHLQQQQHLSPVWEAHGTPSPTSMRKFEHQPSSSVSSANSGMVHGFYPVSSGSVASSHRSTPAAAMVSQLEQPPVVVSSSPSTSTKAWSQNAAAQQLRDAVATSPTKQDPRTAAAPRMNGHVAAASDVSPARVDAALTNGWQKPKGRKKPNDPKHLANGYAQSEQAPKNEADRKGG